MRVVMDPDGPAYVAAATAVFLEDVIGPKVSDAARRFCPVETGALKASIEHHMEADDLVVSATGGAGGREYAAFVELGHRVYHPSTGIVGPEVVPPEPFLRPALSAAVE